MDPEQIRRALQIVQQLRADGRSDREINSLLRQSDLDVNSLNVLTQLGQVEGFVGPEGELRLEEPEPENAADVLTPFIQGATGSFASDILSGLERVGVAREGAAERFRGDLEEQREENPILSTVGQIGGLLGGAGQAGAKGVAAAGRGLGRLAGAGGARAARALGGGGLAQIGGREAARAAGATVGGGAAGAVEGGLIGFGEAAGQPTEERVAESVTPALFGGAIAGPIAGLGSAVGSARRITEATRQRGEVLAEAGERVGRDLPTRRQVSNRVEQANQARREAFKQAEEAGKKIPGEVTDLLASENPIIESSIRNAARQGSPEARRFVEGLDAFRAGDRSSLPAASFELADDVRKQLKFQGDAFARQTSLLGANAPAPSQGAVKEAQRLNSLLTETLEEVPGFGQALRQSAEAGTQARALQTGRQLFSEPADVVEDVVQRGKKVQIGNDAVQIADTPAAKEAARAGLAIPVQQQLRGGASRAESFLQTLDTSSELRKKMEVILGGEEALEEFVTEAKRLQDIGRAGDIAELFVKAAGFLGFGTSLFGGAAVTGLLE